MITADTITDEQVNALFVELTKRFPIQCSNQDIHDLKSVANALGYNHCIVEGVDCRVPPGMEAEFRRRGLARCAEIINARLPSYAPTEPIVADAATLREMGLK